MISINNVLPDVNVSMEFKQVLSSDNNNIRLDIDNIKNDPLDDDDILNFEKILYNNKRTDEEARILYNKVKELGFFERFYQDNNFDRLDDDAMIYLCRKMKYEKMAYGQFVYEEDDLYNDNIYIIYTGCVLVIQKIQEVINGVHDGFNHHQKSKKFKRNNDKRNSTTKSIIVPANMKSRVNHNKHMTVSAMFAQSTPHKFNTFSALNSHHNNHNTDSDANTLSIKPNISIKPMINNAYSMGMSINVANGNINGGAGGIGNSNGNGNSGADKGSSNNNLEINNGNMANIELAESLLEVESTLLKSMEQSLNIEKPINDIIKSKGILKEKLNLGDIFGDQISVVHHIKRRNNSILTNTECAFLIIKAYDIQYVKEKYDKNQKMKREFFLKYFPDMFNINSQIVIDNYLHYLKDEKFTLDNLITEEGKPGELIHIIFNGECELSKTIIFKDDQDSDTMKMKSPLLHTKTINICQIGIGAFIGEELIKEENHHDINAKPGKYEYNARVISSSATIFSLNKRILMHKFPSGCIAGIKEIYHQKKMVNETILKSLIKGQYKGKKLDIQVNNDVVDDTMGNLSIGSPSSNRLILSPTANRNRRPIESCDQMITDQPIVVIIKMNTDDRNIMKDKIKTLTSKTESSFIGNQNTIPIIQNIYLGGGSSNGIIKTETDFKDINVEELKRIYLNLNKRNDPYIQKEQISKSFKKKGHMLRKKQFSEPFKQENAIDNPSMFLNNKLNSKEYLGLSSNPSYLSKDKRNHYEVTYDQETLRLNTETMATQTSLINPFLSTTVDQYDPRSSIKANNMASPISTFGFEHSNQKALTSGKMNSIDSKKDAVLINKPIITIRSKIKKTKDWDTYFKSLEYNFASLREKIPKHDIAYTSDISKFKIDFGGGKTEKLPGEKPKKQDMIKEDRIIMDIKYDKQQQQYHIIKKDNSIKQKLDKPKSQTEEEFLKFGESIPMTLPRVTVVKSPTTLSIPISTPSISISPISASPISSIKMLRTKRITSSSTPNLENNVLINHNEQQDNKDKNINNKNKEYEAHKYNNLRDFCISMYSSPVSPKNIDKIFISPKTTRQPKNNIITQQNVLKWKHQRYLSLTTKPKDKQ